jgi:glycosyltransferase involved in cell wall biosynthesis
MPSREHKIKVAFTVTNCICYDQRVLKIAGVISKLNCDVEIIGRKRDLCCNSQSVPFKTKRFGMLFRKGFLFYMFFNIRLFLYLLFHRHDLLVANDLDTLLPGYLVSRIRKIPLVFDSHEYFTGIPEVQNRPFVKYVWKTIEKSILPGLSNIMTVSNGIASKYREEYRVFPLIVMNCAISSDHIMPVSRESLGIGQEKLVVILQGTGINWGRGGEELIKAVFLAENVFLLIVGSGHALEKMKEMTNELGISGRVKYVSTLPWERMLGYTRSADLGVTLDADTSLNHQFSLPNKLFDYISAGVAVVTSDLPEIREIISEFGCGIILDEVTPENIASTLNELDRNRQKLEELRKNATRASAKLNWENESRKISEFYLRILKENGYF